MGRNLTSLPISASFQYLLQVSGSEVNDGLGNDVDLLTVTASYATQALTASFAENVIPQDTGSLLTTGSVASNVLTFEKGDGSTFNLTVDTGSAVTVDTGSLLNNASGTNATTTYTRGDGTTFDVTVNNVANATSAATANTASYVAGANVDGAVALATSATSATTATSASHAVFADTAGAATDVNALYTASVSDATISFLKGGGGTFPITINNVANAVSASHAITADTASFLPADTNLNINSITASFASFSSASIGYLQSITGSAKIIGDAFIILNNNTPTERFAGLVVQDSGSTQNTASFEFDGQTNDWFYEYTNDGGATTEYGVAMFGPEYNTKGSPTYLTNNTIPKGDGGHHLNDSIITDDGSTVTVAGDLTGNVVTANTYFVGDLIGTASVADSIEITSTLTSSFISIPLVDVSNIGIGGYADLNFDSNNNLLYKPSTGEFVIATGSTLQVEQSALIGQGFPDQGLIVSGSTDINGILSLPGIANVSESIAAAGGASFPYTGSADITGSLTVDGPAITGDATNTAAGLDAASIGGNQNDANGPNSAILGGGEHTVNGERSVIVGGYQNTVSGTDSAVIGGFGQTATGLRSIVAGGIGNDATNIYSATLGGSNNRAEGVRGTILGGDQGFVDSSTNDGVIIGSYLSNIENQAHNSTIINGFQSNIDGYSGSAIIGGTGIDADAHHTVFVPNLHLTGSTGGTLTFADGTTMTTADPFPYTGSAGIQGDLTIDGDADFQGQVKSSVVALSDAAGTTTLDCSTGNFFTLAMPAGGTTALTPTNITAGQTINLKITQNATAATLTYAASIDFPGGTAFTISTGAGEVDVLTLISFDGTSLQATGLANFS